MFLKFGTFDQSISLSWFSLIRASMVYSEGWMRSYFCAARDQLGEHLLVGGVGLVVDLDAGFLGEAVDDGLRHVFGPGEEVELLGRSRRLGAAAEHGGESGGGEDCDAFHEPSLGMGRGQRLRRLSNSVAMTNSTVDRMNTVEMALSVGSSPFLTTPEDLQRQGARAGRWR